MRQDELIQRLLRRVSEVELTISFHRRLDAAPGDVVLDLAGRRIAAAAFARKKGIRPARMQAMAGPTSRSCRASLRAGSAPTRVTGSIP